MAPFFAKWWSRTPSCLGVSLNTSGMTLVQWATLDPALAPWQRWAQEDWASTAASEAPVWDDPVRLGTALEGLRQRAGMSCRRLAMGLPADRVLQQSLQVESDLPARDVCAQVNWRASQALDLAWDEVAFDYQIESPGEVDALHPGGASASSAFLKVNWIACPLAQVRAAQQMSRAARLHLQFLGVEPALTPTWDDAPGWGPEGMETQAPANASSHASGFASGHPLGHAPALSPQWRMACEMARQGVRA